MTETWRSKHPKVSAIRWSGGTPSDKASSLWFHHGTQHIFTPGGWTTWAAVKGCTLGTLCSVFPWQVLNAVATGKPQDLPERRTMIKKTKTEGKWTSWWYSCENTCNKQAGTKGWRFCESQGRQKYYFLSLLKYLQAERVQGAWRNLSDATYSQHHIFHIKLFCNYYGTYVSLPTLTVRPLHHVSFTNVTTSSIVWLALNS